LLALTTHDYHLKFWGNKGCHNKPLDAFLFISLPPGFEKAAIKAIEAVERRQVNEGIPQPREVAKASRNFWRFPSCLAPFDFFFQVRNAIKKVKYCSAAAK